MAGTLGQQVRASANQTSGGRATRTQRVQQQQSQRKAQDNFNQARAEAERLKNEVFVDKDVSTEYKEYVPKKYLDRDGNPTKTWTSLTAYSQQKILRNTKSKDLAVFNKTQTTKDEFTFDEYSQEYEKLSPDVKQFFTSPTEITEEKNKKIASEQSIINNRIEAMKQNIIAKQEAYKKFEEWEQRYKYSTDSDRRAKQEASNDKRMQIKNMILRKLKHN